MEVSSEILSSTMNSAVQTSAASCSPSAEKIPELKKQPNLFEL